MYYSNEDFGSDCVAFIGLRRFSIENFYICHKAEGLPRKISIREYCIRNKVPWNLFNNCKAIGESYIANSHEPNGIAIYPLDEQERQYLIENARRMELLEETLTAPSGRCSDMTRMELEKLIDYLFKQVEVLQSRLAGMQEELRLQREQSAGQHADLASQLERMEKRAVAAEKRADAADKRVAKLTAALTAMTDGAVITDLRAQLAKAEKERDDAKTSDRQNRAERYGSTSRQIRKSDKADKTN